MVGLCLRYCPLSGYRQRLCLPGSTAELQGRFTPLKHHKFVGLGPRHLLLHPCQAVAAPSRMTTIEQVEAAHPEFLDASDLDAAFALNFAQYQKATTSLENLTARSTELQAILDSMGKLEAELDDDLLAVPVKIDDKEARKAKRAARRAERKAKPASTAAVSAQATSAAAPAPAPAEIASSPAAAFATTAANQPIVDNSRQHLEEIFQLSTPEQSVSAQAQTSVLKPRARAPRTKAAALLRTAAPPPPPPPPPAPVQVAAAVAAPHSPAVAEPAPKKQIVLVPQPAPQVDEEEELAAPLAQQVAERAPARKQPKAAATFAAPTVSPQQFDDDEDFKGPSMDDLRELEEQLLGEPSQPEADSGALETSALAVRGPEQTAVMPAGPSILSLVGGANIEASARSKHSRRSAVYTRAVSSTAATKQRLPASRETAGKDGTSNFMRQTNVGLLGDSEEAMTRLCQDYLFLERVRLQCTKALGRSPTLAELGATVNMDEKTILLRYQTGQCAKQSVLRSNYRLVMSICKKFIGKGASTQDLVAEGVKGLLRGVEKYDPTKGFKFATYVHWWIRQAVSRSLAQQGRAVRLPVHMIEQLSKIKHATLELNDELDREPTTEEIAERSGLTVRRIKELMRAVKHSASLEASMSDDNGTTFKDLVEDTRAGADEEVVSKGLKDDIDGILAELTPREAQIIRLRFGLADGREWTLEDIGDTLSVTRERVRQIEGKALRKLRARQQLLSGKLQEYERDLDLLEDKEVASRTSSGTKKT